jgi:hypothetical protein
MTCDSIFRRYTKNMNDEPKKIITWLEYRSQATGKSIEVLRQEMRDRSAKADKSKSGFASMPEKKRLELSSKGGKAGLGRKNGKKAT